MALNPGGPHGRVNRDGHHVGLCDDGLLHHQGRADRRANLLGHGRGKEVARQEGGLSLLSPRLFLTVMMMRRCRGCSAVKRVKTAWLGNTAAMVRYLRIVNSRGSQKWDG